MYHLIRSRRNLMLNKINFQALNLYEADEERSILTRQNGRYTHTFAIPIKSAGTTLILLRSKEEIDDDKLETMIRAGNSDPNNAFDIVYYQTVVNCDMSTDTLRPKTANYSFGETLRLSYRTNITAPSGLPTDPKDMFVANSLASRASRQAGKTTETIELAGVGEEKSDGAFVTLVLLAAQAKGTTNAYEFNVDEGENEDGEGSDNNAIMEFLDPLNQNGNNITEAQILGYFPKDQPDFEAFVRNGFTITVNGNATLGIEQVINE